MKRIVLILSFFLVTSKVASQEKEIPLLRYLTLSNGDLQFTYDGLIFYKQTRFDKREVKEIRKDLKEALRDPYHVKKRKKTIVFSDSLEVKKTQYYCKLEKKQGVFYKHSIDKKNTFVNIGATYNDLEKIKRLDTVVAKILKNEIPKSNKIVIDKGVLFFDKLKIQIDTVHFNNKLCCGLNLFKSKNGYLYQLSLFDSKLTAQENVTEFLLKNKIRGIENKYVVEIDDENFDVFRFDYTSDNKNYENNILSFFKYKSKYMVVKSHKCCIDNSRELKIPSEFLSILKQVHQENTIK